MPTEIDYARLAAYVDGEGTISIKQSHLRGRILRVIRVGVTNTDPRLVQWCKSTFGCGSIYLSERHNKKHKAAYRWECHSKSGVALIEAMYPYLIIKREQAEVAMAFRKLQHLSGGHITKNGVVINVVAEEARVRLVGEMRNLNQRGTLVFKEMV